MDSIQHLEDLSKFQLLDDEREEFAEQFKNIVAFVDQIKEIEIDEDLEEDKPISISELREDKTVESLDRTLALKNAPKQKDGCFVTPLVVE